MGRRGRPPWAGRCGALALLACASCLAAPPGGSPGADGGPPSSLRVLGVFERDAFGFESTESDLTAAVAYQGSHYVLHLPATGGGLAALMDGVDAIDIPFEPVGMTGADVDGDDLIDLVAVGSGGELAVLGNTAAGLDPLDTAVVVVVGDPPHDITSIEAPDLAGEERIFLAGPDGIWQSEPLDIVGQVHFEEVTPRMTGVDLPASFIATHDDEASWYVGFAHGTSVDLWELFGFDRVTEDELIGYQAPSAPSIGHWRRLADPLRVVFFGVLADSNRVVWVSEQFGAAEANTELDLLAPGPIRDLTVHLQPEGYDLITLSQDPEGAVGVQVKLSLTAPGDALPLGAATSLVTSIDTSLPIWVRAASVTASPYAGREILVFDQVGHLLCLEFDASHRTLTSCGEADLRPLMAEWIAGG